jgi:AcrR family transcriptional regulator
VIGPSQRKKRAIVGSPQRRIRLGGKERREQIVVAATRAFARGGFAATSLDDVATEAGITRVLVYRHFDSKATLYRAVLDRVCTRLVAACGDHGFTDDAIDGLVTVATEEPEGFRLLFQYAAHEPAFHPEMSDFRAAMTATAHAELADQVSDPIWASWAAQLTPTVAVAGILAWLDAGRPEPGQAAARIRHTIEAVIEAADARPT